MFTSRAEYRLSLRADNADQRLTPSGIKINCVGENRTQIFLDKQKKLTQILDYLKSNLISPNEASKYKIKSKITQKLAKDNITIYKR